MKDIIQIIHNILNKLLLSNDNYVLLDNNNTMNYYYNNNFYNIIFIHNLSYINLLNLINELNNNKFKLLHKFYNYSNLRLLYKYELVEYEFSIIRESIKSKINNYKNIYYDIIKLDYIYNNDCINIANELIDKYNSFTLDKDIFNLIELIIFYLKNNNKLEDNLKNIIEKSINNVLSLLNTNNMLKIIIKKNINEDYSNNISRLVVLLKELEIKNKLNEFIKYDIINYIFFDLTKVNTYNININTIDQYLILVLLEKYKIVKNEAFKLEINYLDNDDDLYLLIDRDRIIDLKKIKDSINILININSIINKIELVDKVNIKTYIIILSILFYVDENEKNNIDSLKMGYIYKLYQNIDIVNLKEIFNFYNKIITKLEMDIEVSNPRMIYEFNYYKINENDYIYKMIENKTIKEFENKKILNIPIVAKKFNEKIDTITILDYQDAIIILYEYIYNDELNINLLDNIDYLEELFDAIITNIKSNKLIKNNNYKKSIKSYNFIIDYNEDSDNIIINTKKYNEENGDDEDDEDDENEDSEEIKYKYKYKKSKIKFNRLKIVKNILLNYDIDKNIFDDYDEIDDELIEIILEKYNNEDII